MTKDTLALILLLGVMVLALIGAALWVGGSNRRAALAARGREERGGSAYRAALEHFDTRLRRTRQGQMRVFWQPCRLSARDGSRPVSPLVFLYARTFRLISRSWRRPRR